MSQKSTVRIKEYREKSKNPIYHGIHLKYATGQLISVYSSLHIEKSSKDITGQLISVYMSPDIDKSIVIFRANDVPRQLRKRM